MRDNEKELAKAAKRADQYKAAEAEQLAKEQVRKKAYLAREQALEKAGKAKQTKRAGKRASEEAGEVKKEQARREAHAAREQAIAEDQEARKLKAKERLSK